MKTFFLLPVDFSESKEMTFPRVCRERLMLAPSCRQGGREGGGRREGEGD